MEISQLIERCKHGDADALGELYKAYARRMKGVCRRYIRDEQTVDDVLHDAFVIIFTSFDRLRDNSKAESWMMAITRNVSLKYKEHLESISTLSLDEINEAELLSEENEDKSIRGIPLDELIRMIDRLPAGYSKVFRLAVFEGMSHQEIARLLDIEPHSSSSQLARAKRMLRSMMQRYWALLLLLLLPLTMLLFKKNDSQHDSQQISKIPSNKTEKEKSDRTTEPRPSRERQNIVSKITRKRLPVKSDTLQKLIVYAVDSVIPTDTLTRIIATEEQADTTNKQPSNRQQPAIPQYDMAITYPGRTTSENHDTPRWSLQMAYTGGYNEQNNYNQPYSFKPYINHDKQDMPAPGQPATPDHFDNWSDYAVYLANNMDATSAENRNFVMQIALNNAKQPGEDKILRTSHHYMPVVWSLAMRYELNRRWNMESGLNYSKLYSEFKTGSDGNEIAEQQTIHYLGIPVKGIYNMYRGKTWSIYGSAGLTVEMPVYSPLYTKYYVSGMYKAGEKKKLRAPWQFSTSMGLGLQYHLTPTIGIFAEPSLQYYIPTRSEIETYRTEHPFIFTLPVGIRFTW